MINYIKKFGFWEYVFFIVGLIIISKQVYGYIMDTQELTFPHLVVFIIGCLMMVSPITLVRVIKKYANKQVEK